MQKSRFNIGLIVDPQGISKHTYDLIEWAHSQSNPRTVHLFYINSKSGPPTSRKAFVESFKGMRSWRKVEACTFNLIIRLERFLFRSRRDVQVAFRRYSIEEVLGESLAATLEPSVDNGYVFSKEEIEKMKSLNLDLIVWLSPFKFDNKLINASRIGVIMLVQGDDRVNRGAPAGFWEVFNRRESTGFTIVNYTTSPSSYKVILRGGFPTRVTALLNQVFLLNKGGYYLAKLVRETAQSGALPAEADSLPYYNPLYETPTIIEQLRYIFVQITSSIRRAISAKVLKQNYSWGVAFSRSNWKNLTMSRSIKIDAPKNHFLADPFVIKEGNRDFCFLEDYDFETNHGSIAVYELRDKDSVSLGNAILESFHVSFPYIFRFKAKLYMCPETSANNDIRIYECVNFPLEWKHVKTVMQDVCAADSMIFEYNGLWWLFTNIDPLKLGENCSELLIFYTDNPLGDNWMAHPKNPIYIDPAKARNGGILFDDAGLYRVSQQQGFNIYGRGISINRVTVLDKENYCETPVCSIAPNFFEHAIGAHHLHCNGQVSVFDYAEIR